MKNSECGTLVSCDCCNPASLKSIIQWKFVETQISLHRLVVGTIQDSTVTFAAWLCHGIAQFLNLSDSGSFCQCPNNEKNCRLDFRWKRVAVLPVLKLSIIVVNSLNRVVLSWSKLVALVLDCLKYKFLQKKHSLLSSTTTVSILHDYHIIYFHRAE